jgi:hypothetical protein
MNITNTFPDMDAFLQKYESIANNVCTLLVNKLLSCNQLESLAMSPFDFNKDEFIQETEICSQMGLSEDNKMAFIAHEFGHAELEAEGKAMGGIQEETDADHIAVQIVGKKLLEDALNKIMNYYGNDKFAAILGSYSNSNGNGIFDHELKQLEFRIKNL